MHGTPLERAEIKPAVRALARAFAEDPVYRSLWPVPEQRARALERFMAVPVADAYDHGHVTVLRSADEGILGVAAWLPPGGFPFSARRKLRALPRMLRVFAVSPSSARRLMRFGANIEAAFPDERPAYLAVVGVVPEAQGRGAGTALLATGLAICDETGSAAYLETPSERAMRLYRRLGWEVVESGAELLPDGPAHWRMLRAARA